MDTFTKAEIEEIVLSSNSYAEVMRKMGYKSNSGSSLALLKQKLTELDISVDHFGSLVCNKIKRTEENVFI